MSTTITAAEITVSAVESKDQSQWESLYRGYADFYQVPMNDQILETVWSWLQDPHNPFYGLVARNQEGTPMGLMHYRAMPSPLRGTTVGFLDDLYVEPDSRGTQAAKALFEALQADADAKGWPLVRWITADNNYRARALYDQLATRTGWITYQMDSP